MAPDEGHGFARPVNSMAMFAAAEKFLAKHLNGRHQEDMKPEVATRLKEITVDPKVVTLTKKVDPASIAAPKPAVDLKAGTSAYNAKIEVGAQSISMSTVIELREEGGSWIVSETAKLPTGEAVDTATVEKGTLILRKRTVKQGPVVIDLSFEGGKATGTMAMGGQSKPVSVDLGGPLFGDGSAALPSFAALPLADGYTTTFRNFDVQKQKVALKQLKVTGNRRGHRSGGNVQGVQARDHVRRRRARLDDGVGRDRLAQGREDDRNTASDGRGEAHVGTGQDDRDELEGSALRRVRGGPFRVRPFCFSLMPQRPHRIESGRAPGRGQASGRRHREQEHRDQHVNEGIERVGFVEERRDRSAEREGSEQSQAQAGDGRKPVRRPAPFAPPRPHLRPAPSGCRSPACARRQTGGSRRTRR